MDRREFNGPSIPQSLLGQLGDATRSDHNRLVRKASASRKARRQSERVERKAVIQKSRKRPGTTKIPLHAQPGRQCSKDSTASFLIRPTERSDRHVRPPKSPNRANKTTESNPEPASMSASGSEVTSYFSDEETIDDARPLASSSILRKLAEDDQEIARLERKLGIKNKRSNHNSTLDEMDSILNGLGSGSEDDTPKFSKRKRATEDDDWLARKRQGTSEMVHNSEDRNLQGRLYHGKEDISETLDDGAECGHIQSRSLDANVIIDGTRGMSFSTSRQAAEERKSIRENPYVAPQTKSAPVKKYIPPSLRNDPPSDAETSFRLRRQLQGFLNRLSEDNILTIVKDIEHVYAANPRHYVTKTLLDLLISLISDATVLLDTFLILHAGFVAALYKLIGVDFGAQFVEQLVTKFDKFYEASLNSSHVGKETSNLISLMAELYNLQVVGCNLVFDYLRTFLGSMSDLHTELILRVVKLSGQQLRQDDPSSLKDIVMLLQDAVLELGESNMTVRTRFMVETISSLKNNRMKTGIATSAVHAEHLIRMRKTLGSLNDRYVKSSEPLRIGLDDMRDIDKRGKWWLIGASWKGDSIGNRDKRIPVNGSTQQDVQASYVAADLNAGLDDDLDSPFDLLALARSQGMNTDVRRAVFVTIMSATDYRDAHLRLLKLRLKKAQELEIPRVIIKCVGSEQSYNPYYTLIARKLCANHKTRMAFQFALWDVLKQLGSEDGEQIGEDNAGGTGDTRRVVNLARMYSDMILDDKLPITCLRTVDFLYTPPRARAFVEILLVTVILQTMRKKPADTNGRALLELFQNAKEVPDLARGLRIFLERVVCKSAMVDRRADKDVLWRGCKALSEILAESRVAEAEGDGT